MNVKIRIQNHGPIGGWTAQVLDHGVWRPVLKYVGGALVSFDSREQAINAANLQARKMVAHDRECEKAALAVLKQRPTSVGA